MIVTRFAILALCVTGLAGAAGGQSVSPPEVGIPGLRDPALWTQMTPELRANARVPGVVYADHIRKRQGLPARNMSKYAPADLSYLRRFEGDPPDEEPPGEEGEEHDDQGDEQGEDRDDPALDPVEGWLQQVLADRGQPYEAPEGPEGSWENLMRRRYIERALPAGDAVDDAYQRGWQHIQEMPAASRSSGDLLGEK